MVEVKESPAQQRASALIQKWRNYSWGRNSEFAPGYTRQPETNWIEFGRDVEAARRLFPEVSMEHPAKMQLELTAELIAYMTDPGDWVMDVFGGTGRTGIASIMGRHSILVEIEDEFCGWIKQAAPILLGTGSWLDGKPASWKVKNLAEYFSHSGGFRLYQGDNRQVMEYMIEEQAKGAVQPTAIICSPPYSNTLKNSGRMQAAHRDDYKGDPNNMGNLNPFMWERAMKDLLGGIFPVLAPGGLVALVNKDMRVNEERELLSIKLIRAAESVGFKQKDWFKWITPGTMRTRAMLAMGREAILDEDILIVQKPG